VVILVSVLFRGAKVNIFEGGEQYGQLGESRPVAEVEKQNSAEVAPPVDPAGQAHRAAGVFGPQLAAPDVAEGRGPGVRPVYRRPPYGAEASPRIHGDRPTPILARRGARRAPGVRDIPALPAHSKLATRENV
jgi:hypothetical protein